MTGHDLTVTRAVGIERTTTFEVGLNGRAVVLRYQGLDIKLKPEGARELAAALS